MATPASYILSIDQGTSSTKTLLFNGEGQVGARASEPLASQFPENGYVEQDPEELYRHVLRAVQKCLAAFTAAGGDIAAIKCCGISNQRETFVIWDRDGKPLYNAIVWQCKRSVDICKRLQAQGLQHTIQERTGLLIDPYFSGSKLIWLYENVDKVRNAIDNGNACFGTVDTWLLYRLTNGQSYFTDYTNASRTLFFNLSALQWDTELLDAYGLSRLLLPAPKPSAAMFGESDFNGLFPQPIPITGMIGDSHAAAFGEGCLSPGTAKATLGTGCSVLMNVGQERKQGGKGMVSTICWSTGNRVDYALEGIIVSCGATIEWLKNELGLFADSRQTADMATAVTDNNGVYLVPAFSGLGAPHWDMSRKAAITGLSFDCNKHHIIRAALESVAYQIKDVIVAMEQQTGVALQELMVDGGITSNPFVLQFLTDLLERPVANIGLADVSALGAAYLAGLQAGVFRDFTQLEHLKQHRAPLYPGAGSEKAKAAYLGWQEALKFKV